jgi:hypothetical protein
VENSVTKTQDPFSIKIALRHPSYSPQRISEALSLRPEFSHAVGQIFLKAPARWTVFYATLQKGDYASEYEGALTKVALFLERNSIFWADFIGGDGEVELILNHAINPQDEEGDKCFELYLAPAFLRDLSTRGIGLRVQGWQGKTVQTAHPRKKKVSRVTKAKARS